MVTDITENEPAPDRAFDYDRTVALSDGVFSIALTLLVLTISFPALHGSARSHLGSQLQDRLPQLYSYGVTFAVLAFLWLRHHAFFRGLARIDARLAILNLAYLAVIAFLPYPTRLLGEYGNQAVSVAVYATTIILISGLAALHHIHAERAGLLAPGTVADPWRHHLAAPIVFLVSIPLAYLVSPSLAEWSWLSLLILARLPRRRRENPGNVQP